MFLYNVLLKIVIHMNKCFLCNLGYSKPYETALSLYSYAEVEDEESLSRECYYSCKLQRFVEVSGGKHSSVSTFSQSIRKWIRKIKAGLFFKCVLYSCPWKEERLTNQDFGDSLTSIRSYFPCLASLCQHS